MKVLFKYVLVFTFSLSAGLLPGQTGKYFSLEEITHGNTSNSEIYPTRVEVNSMGGVVEVEILYYGECKESYRFEYAFSQDMSSLKAGENFLFEYKVDLISSQCNNNRNATIRPATPLGGSSALAASLPYSDWVNALGVQEGAFTYAKDMGRPKVYQTAELKGKFVPVEHKLGAHTWLSFILSAPSNLPGEQFNYEILYIYKISNEAGEKSFLCPPPDCSGFPGTIPVWNFQSNKGECWCPEGMKWDKLAGKCVTFR